MSSIFKAGAAKEDTTPVIGMFKAPKKRLLRQLIMHYKKILRCKNRRIFHHFGLFFRSSVAGLFISSPFSVNLEP